MFFFNSYQGVVDSSGISICSSVSGILYSQGTCSPLDRSSDVLIYVEQLVRTDRPYRCCGVIGIHAQDQLAGSLN